MRRSKKRFVIGTYNPEDSATLEKYLKAECVPSATVRFPEQNAIYYFVETVDRYLQIKVSAVGRLFKGRFVLGDITDSAKDVVTAIGYAEKKVENAQSRIGRKKQEIAYEADRAIISGKSLPP